MPDRLPEVEYDEHEIIRIVPKTKNYVSFKGRLWSVPQAFRGERVAIRSRNPDGHYYICFGARVIARIDLTAQPVSGMSRTGVRHVPGLNSKRMMTVEFVAARG